MTSLESNSESPKATRARFDFLATLFARFEAASGKRIDAEGTGRKKQLIQELTLRRYSEREARIAQEWILKGDPVRYGSLTLADFFPTKEHLAKIGFDFMAELRKAEALGFRKGYDAGRMDERNGQAE